jgi:hypothetical protein
MIKFNLVIKKGVIKRCVHSGLLSLLCIISQPPHPPPLEGGSREKFLVYGDWYTSLQVIGVLIVAHLTSYESTPTLEGFFPKLSRGGGYSN